MADIDQIIAGGAGASSRADFSGIPKLLDSYWAGLDQRAKNDLRDAFKPTANNPNGVPLTPDGQIDIPTVAKTLFQKGDVAGGTSLLGQATNVAERAAYAGGGSQPQQAAQAPIVSPPSANRTATAVVAPPLAKGGVQGPGQSPQGDQPGSIVGLVSAAGIPDELAGPYIQQISAQTKTDPNAALNPELTQRVQQVAQAAAQRMKAGQQQQVAQQAPQQIAQAQPQGFQPSPQQAAAQNDPQLKRLRFMAASPDKSVAESARAELKSYIESKQPTTEMKNAAAQGVSLRESLDRTDENTTKRDILTKSIIPRLDKSQETAMAARNDIDTLHRARAELDRPGGVFTGAFAGNKLELAKAAELFGLSNADKIANTEAFSSAAGQRVASLIKAFGSGTAISDGDRRFTEAIAGGRITLDEKSIRRILDIGEKADRLLIERHNTFADKAVAANEGLKSARDTYIVEHPGQYKKPEPAVAASFPKFNSASDVQSAIASKKLKSGDAFLTSDGRTKYVP